MLLHILHQHPGAGIKSDLGRQMLCAQLNSSCAKRFVGQRHQGTQQCTWRAHALEQSHGVPAPWSLTFDLRERETEWTEENKARLVALVAAQKLSMPMAEMEQRLEALMLLLPDLAGHVQGLQPSLLAALTSDLQNTSSKILALKELLPEANISQVVARRPQLLLQDTVQIQAAVEALQKLLSVDKVDRLIEAQPLFLVTECVEEVLEEVKRLMPSKNAAELLISDPGWLLRAQRGQQWLGLNPDSQLGEQVDWKPPSAITP